MISLRNYNKNLHRSYRSYIGRNVAIRAREMKIIYERIENENHYPIEFLDYYFSENPIPVKHDGCEPIYFSMIKELPIKMLFTPKSDDGLTTDGFNVFCWDKCVGFWI